MDGGFVSDNSTVWQLASRRPTYSTDVLASAGCTWATPEIGCLHPNCPFRPLPPTPTQTSAPLHTRLSRCPLAPSCRVRLPRLRHAATRQPSTEAMCPWGLNLGLEGVWIYRSKRVVPRSPGQTLVVTCIPPASAHFARVLSQAGFSASQCRRLTLRCISNSTPLPSGCTP